jgi:hypothetical protein
MISDRHRFIYVHTPKSGGSSIEEVLLKNEIEIDDVNFQKKFWADNLSIKLKKKFFIGKTDQKFAPHHYTTEMLKTEYPNKFKNYFKFTFVRNPWDKVVSEWLYFKKIDPEYNFAFKESINNKSYWNKPYPFEEHTWSQVEFASECDYVGRFESLQKDFDTVCEMVGITKQKLPHRNKSKCKNYIDYYDDESKEMVAKKYAKDIEYFGYKFGY